VNLSTRRRIGNVAWALLDAFLPRPDVQVSDRSRELPATPLGDQRAAAEMRDHLMAGTLHDLKTPLATIRLLTHLMRRDADNGKLSPDHLRERAMLIELNVNKMSALISELLDVARLQRGGAIELQLAETDLLALAHRVADSFEVTADKSRLRVEAAEPQLAGMWDAARLERVLANLVGNALKYSPAGGDVIVRLAREQRSRHDVAVVSVIDRGLGIPAADLPHVFDWFHRAGNVGDLAGTGVGLPSAKLIVEKHGGTIRVSSREGKGTTVTLRLPVPAPVPRVELQPESEEVTPPAGERLAAGRE
jgi:signal transduction histidine kinase